MIKFWSVPRFGLQTGWLLAVVSIPQIWKTVSCSIAQWLSKAFCVLCAVRCTRVQLAFGRLADSL